MVLASGCSPIFGLEAPTRAPVEADASIVPDEQVVPDAQPDASFGSWYDIQRAFPSTGEDDDPTLTRDELEMYFDRGYDIFVVRRASMLDAWSSPVKVTELSTNQVESAPEVYANGLFMTFASTRAPSMNADVWVSIRNNPGEPWGSPSLFEAINSAAHDGPGPLSDDGLTFAMSSERNAGRSWDLFLSQRMSQAGLFGAAVEITELNTVASENAPFLTGDGNTLYFSSDRDGDEDLYVSTRILGGWGAPMPMTELNTPGIDADPWLSHDGKRIYFASDRDGKMGIWTARRD